MTTLHHSVSSTPVGRLLAERFVRHYEDATEILSGYAWWDRLDDPRATILSTIHKIDKARYEASRELLNES